MIFLVNKFDFKDTDTRVRRYISPVKIIKTEGDIENAAALTEYCDRQVQLQERDVTIMRGRGHILLDFGCEFHGGAMITVYKVRGKDSARLHLRFGESVGEALAPLGFKGACNDHSARDFTVEVMSYSTNEYAMTGYRFLYIELCDDCEVYFKTVQGVFVYQPYEYVGSFECSDKRLNEIYDVSAYTCHLCMQNQLWDGIKRDRLVWIGDMSPELKTIKYVFGDKPEIMSGLTLAAKDAALPAWVNTIPTYSMWWLINLNEWCEYTGDFSHAEKLKDYTLSLTRQIVENIDGDGYFTAGEFIDWPSKGYPSAKEGTRALAIMCMDACAKLCKKLGSGSLADECEKTRALASKKQGGAGNLKQIAALLELNGICDDEGKALLKKGGAFGFSTFMSYYILTATARLTDTDSVLDALKEYYGGMLDMGATTFFEDFDVEWTKNACAVDEIPTEDKSDIHGDNGNYCYLGYRHSLCHGWASGPVPFLTEHVLGISLADGCKRIKISPNLGSLDYARGSIATPYGKLTVSHIKNADGSIKTEINAPKEIEII